MFLELLIGGPADGDIVHTDSLSLDADQVVHKETGAVYVRATDRDTPEHRAWSFDRYVHSDDPDPLVLRAPDQMTLGELSEFLTAAASFGWPDSTPVHVSSWFGKLRKITVRHPKS